MFDDVGSGSLKHRPQLDACLKFLAAGDTLVVWRLDRLGRGLKHLIELVEQLHDREIGFHSLTEQIDTTTPGGRMQFHVFGALAEFEREIIRERTRAGLAAARARKRFGGRPTVINADKLSAARRMRAEKRSMHAIANTLGISRSTLYRHLTLDEQGDQPGPVLGAVSPEGCREPLAVVDDPDAAGASRGRAPAVALAPGG